MTGIRQRSQTGRCLTLYYSDLHPFFNRKRIKVSKIVVHENFAGPVNDIALLKLGKIIPGEKLFTTRLNQFTEDRVNLADFSPACLPSNGESPFNYEKGYVYGE